VIELTTRHLLFSRGEDKKSGVVCQGILLQVLIVRQEFIDRERNLNPALWEESLQIRVQVGCGAHPEASRKSGRQIGENVGVKVRRHQDIQRLGVEDRRTIRVVAASTSIRSVMTSG